MDAWGRVYADFGSLSLCLSIHSEPMLFVNQDRHPQYPEKCVLPDAAAKDQRRRLGGSISQEAAEMACSRWSSEAKSRCIYDVMATGDLELAEAGSY